MIEIVDSSAEVKALITPDVERKNDTFVSTHHKSVYKFEQLHVGRSMIVHDLQKESTLRQLSIRYGRKLKRKFTVMKHYGVIEVGRIA